MATVLTFDAIKQVYDQPNGDLFSKSQCADVYSDEVEMFIGDIKPIMTILDKSERRLYIMSKTGHFYSTGGATIVPEISAETVEGAGTDFLLKILFDVFHQRTSLACISVDNFKYDIAQLSRYMKHAINGAHVDIERAKDQIKKLQSVINRFKGYVTFDEFIEAEKLFDQTL